MISGYFNEQSRFLFWLIKQFKELSPKEETYSSIAAYLCLSYVPEYEELFQRFLIDIYSKNCLSGRKLNFNFITNMNPRKVYPFKEFKCILHMSISEYKELRYVFLFTPFTEEYFFDLDNEYSEKEKEVFSFPSFSVEYFRYWSNFL